MLYINFFTYIYKMEVVNFSKTKLPRSEPLFVVIRGSHAYGTNIPTSDIDYSGVYIQHIDDILGNKYVEQINDDKNDIVFYEVRRFLELLEKNNPTVLEILYTPEDCIIYKHPIFDEILKNRDKFLTKICANSFGGYARTQIQKARGGEKKQNWEKERVERKEPIDFCYLLVEETRHKKFIDSVGEKKSTPVKEFLDFGRLDPKYCGLSKVPNSKDIYALFYDFKGEESLESQFRGISFEDSNDIRLSSIPKNSNFLGYISYNKEGYSKHCSDWKSYQTWLKERNISRWVDVKSHGQRIDGKNMMHCRRLIDMSREIAEGKGVIVKRPDAEDLLKIRRGEVDLNTLIEYVESQIVEVERLFKESDLPDKVNEFWISEMIVKIRRGFK